MNVRFRKFQEGGAVPEQAAPADAQMAGAAAPEQAGGDPVMQLVQAAVQAVESSDCNLAMQVCQGLVQLVQAAGGGGAPAQEQTEPVYRKGGVLVKRIRK